MKKLALLFLLASCSGTTANAPAAKGDPPPSIVLIVTDDQGYGDLGATGNRVIDTPHMDALARDGAGIETFYVSPVCAPTRASLMTGRYNYRTRVVDTWVGRAMMEPDETTVAEVLRDAGFATGIFGKWHLGDSHPMRPMDQGFEESLVHLGGGLAQPSEPPENGRRYTNPILFQNGAPVHTHGYCTDVYFDAALKWISEVHKAGRPFFVYLPTNAPHGPFHDVPQALYEKYLGRDLGPVLLGGAGDRDRVARVFAMIENIDQNVGRLIDKLDTLGIGDDTLVVFMVDNGPNSVRYVGNMRGKKGEVYEGGIRSPFFLRWPARLKAGRKSDRIAAHVDVMPTLLEAAGVALPKGLKLDGRSLLPLVEGKKVAWPDRTIFIQAHRGDRPLPYHHFAARSQRWKLIRPTGFSNERPSKDAPFELYDMANDPREEHDLAAQRPEVTAALRERYDAWFRDVSSTRPHNYEPPRIVIGTDHETTTLLTKQNWRRSEGPGWGVRGRWLVHVARAARFDATVRLKEALRGRAELRIGSARAAVEATGLEQSLTFRNLRVPAGDAEVEFTLTHQGKTSGPHQVVLTRQ
ncbi:MAG: arylsulfatase [Proteobacteria bacterium]|nr:arylsulfatase [Pseudomonadota bacterium]